MAEGGGGKEHSLLDAKLVKDGQPFFAVQVHTVRAM
jgi:hypothetical protein